MRWHIQPIPYVLFTDHFAPEKEKKRVNKAAAAQADADDEGETPLTVTPEMLREALEAIKNEPVPTLEQREGYFMTQVSMGEQMASQGM